MILVMIIHGMMSMFYKMEYIDSMASGRKGELETWEIHKEHLDTIEKNGQLYQVMKVLRVNRLRTAILNNSIEEIGKFKTVERLVNLNADRKRQWFEKLTDINDKKMIDSLPLSLSFFAKESL